MFLTQFPNIWKNLVVRKRAPVYQKTPITKCIKKTTKLLNENRK